MHNGISTWIEVGRPLGNPCKNKKEFLPEGVHCEHFMSSIPVVEKCLSKKRQVPVQNKKEKNWHELVNFKGAKVQKKSEPDAEFEIS